MDIPALASRVTSVTVYRQGAMVTRTATLRPSESGPPDAVRIEGLPMLLHDSTLRVELVAEGEGATPVAGDVRVTVCVPEPDADLRPPTNEELDAARVAQTRAELAERDLAMLHTKLQGLAPGQRGEPAEGECPIPSPMEAREALLDFRAERLARLRPQITEAAETTRLARERLATLEERERTASTAKNPRDAEARKAVVIGLLAMPEQRIATLRLELRYFVPGARWAPFYVMRIDPDLRGGTLEQRAVVGQATGEDWADVALTLSTASPQQWTELPELQSMRIGRKQPPVVRKGWRPPPAGTDALYADYDREVGGSPTSPPPPPQAAPPSSPAQDEDSDELDGVAIIGETATVPLDQPESIGPPMSAQAESTSIFRGAMAPPPASAPPPAPARSGPIVRHARARLPSRTRGPSGMVQSSGGAPMPESSKGTIDRELAVEEPAAAFGAARGVAEPEPLTADRALLDYQRLRVPAADRPKRGTLRRAAVADLYGQLADLPTSRLHAALESGRVQQRRALRFEQDTPPKSHRWPDAVDGFDYAYRVGANADVPSDGSLHALTIGRPSVAITPRYIVVPRETADVFRVLAFRNPIDAPLLHGPVDIYVDGRFVLASPLDTTAPGGRVELGLGVEQAIKVARNVAFDDEASGLLKRHRELEHRVRIEISNRLAQEATVEVRERVPIPASDDDDDIEVQEHEVEPAWDELTQDDPELRGGRVWKVVVRAGEKRELSARWSIRIPNNHEVVGGNRRES